MAPLLLNGMVNEESNMICPSCKKSQPMAFRCQSCGAELMRGRYRGQASSPARSRPVAASGGAAAATMDNPYQTPQAAAVRFHTPAEGQVLASRGSRLAASLIDGMIACALMIPIFVSAAMADAGGSNSAPMGGALVFGSGILLMAFVVYQISMLVREGQTIGKKAMKIRIVDYNSGEVPGWGKLLGLRYGVNSALGNIPLYSLIDILLIFGEERRCIHDYLAGTKVVDA
jgi:uncharacterized RDD family membrane protein YckC